MISQLARFFESWVKFLCESYEVANMTSQVALMNHSGVALASDSVVTFGDSKTFPDVSKIFTLGHPHQIAIMISGSASYIPGGILWERVISLWKENLGNLKAFDTFEEYVASLIGFLKSNEKINVTEQNEFALQRAIIRWLMDYYPIKVYFETLELSSNLGGLEVESTNLTGDFEKNIEIECFKELKKFKIHQDKCFEDWMNNHEFALRYERLGKSQTKIIHFVSSFFEDIFQHHHTHSDDWNDDSVKGVDFSELILRHISFQLTHELSKDVSGLIHQGQEKTCITVAGFGENDISPKMVELVSAWNEWGSESKSERLKHPTARIIEGFYLRKISSYGDSGRLYAYCDQCLEANGKFVNMEKEECVHSPNRQNQNRRHQSAPAFVRGIAIRSEIDTVLNGMRRESFRGLMDTGEYAAKTTEELCNIILTNISELKGFGKVAMKNLTEMFQEDTFPRIFYTIQSKLHQSIEEDGWVKRRQEFREVIAKLPMSDLARFSRHLVNHESEIMRLTNPVRSVGGKITVLTITKEEGPVFHD